MFNSDHREKYSTYTAEDFLLDSFFIQSIKEPTEESDIFWFDFTESDPANIHEFIQAKEILLAIKDDQNKMLSELEMDQLLDNIMVINHATRQRRKSSLKYWMGAAVGVAACVVAAILLFPRAEQLPIANEEILSYIEKNKTVDLRDTTVKLIISDKKMIIAEESEPAITYDSDDIKLATEEISKEESSEFNQLIVPYGKRSRLTLSDGTKIWVNAGTVVTYPIEFGEKGKREIYVNGEAYLDVKKDTDRPFIVKTDKFDIQVLGTKFNVSTYENEINNVVLASGAVKILSSNTNSPAVFLKPNEMYLLDNGKSIKKQVNVEYYTSWINGLYIFENEQLGVIMKRLSKYYGKSIKCSPEISKLECSGKLDLKESLNDILNNLSTISSMKYTSDNNNYQIY
ncbi:FecR family protein [Dysgonomonas sp. BGC7]|uniref:FecR family protein n=1 Tax=Dysgonomonas sp. BGC7 TaxID=1658008 RepID=UPI00068339E9|nr:FecR domain-containing protein [Dysgonomonas sp. BGC7]MBD8390323.1 FecR domain-containing protein [Dysgonomonas sp. BGC7]